jgi:mono/diheme cytochrome c family protein
LVLKKEFHMSKFTPAVLLMACAFSAPSLGMAQQTKPTIKNVPLQQTSPASGQQMYSTYCATCHGVKATGNGPAAPALKIPPTDLTTLSLKNGGVFPTNHVMSVLQLGVDNPAHGSAEMPVWGDLFLSLNSSSRSAPSLVRQRVFNLTKYLKQVQQ